MTKTEPIGVACGLIFSYRVNFLPGESPAFVRAPFALVDISSRRPPRLAGRRIFRPRCGCQRNVADMFADAQNGQLLKLRMACKQ